MKPLDDVRDRSEDRKPQMKIAVDSVIKKYT